MKINLLKYVAIAAIAVLGLGFVSCEKKNEVKFDQNPVENPYSDEELLKSIKFIGQGGLSESTVNKKTLKAGQSSSPDFITVRFRIATPKSGCKDGFGLCDGEV